MDYYELSQSKKVENAIEILGLDQEKYCYAMEEANFEALDKLKVAYYSGREFEELCDILIAPTFMVSDYMKKLMELYEKAYSTSSLNNIRGDLRNGSNIIAENVTPAEALEALDKWGVEHDEEFRTLSEQRKQKENMAENKTETEELGNCDSKN